MLCISTLFFLLLQSGRLNQLVIVFQPRLFTFAPTLAFIFSSKSPKVLSRMVTYSKFRASRVEPFQNITPSHLFKVWSPFSSCFVFCLTFKSWVSSFSYLSNLYEYAYQAYSKRSRTVGPVNRSNLYSKYTRFDSIDPRKNRGSFALKTVLPIDLLILIFFDTRKWSYTYAPKPVVVCFLFYKKPYYIELICPFYCSLTYDPSLYSMHPMF